MKYLCILLVLIVAMAFANVSEGAHRYVILENVASRIAGYPVEVRCLTQQESLSDWSILWGAAAYTHFDPLYLTPFPYAVLSFDTCRPLYHWLKRELDQVNWSNLGFSVMALTHESYHLQKTPAGFGDMNEGRVQCKAIRHTRYVALMLGMSDEQANLVLHWALYWDRRIRRIAAKYDFKNCERPGQPQLGPVP